MAGASTGWEATLGQHPYPPANVMVHHAFMEGCLDIRWDDPATLNTGPVHETTQATATILVSGTPAVAVTATGTITVGALLSGGETLVIAGVTLTGFPGARTPGQNNFDATVGTTTLLAAEIANAINDLNNGFRTYVTATAAGAVVTLTAVATGTAGNAVTLVSSSGFLALSGAALAGGVDADVLLINGRTLTAVAGARTSGSNDFSVSGTNFAIADSIRDAVNDSTNLFTSTAAATSDSGQVTLTAVPVGVRGNDLPLSTTSSVLTVSGAWFTGGVGLTACAGKSNATWTIVGVNIYRSDTGDRGPYFRVNKLPVGSTFYRDCTSNVLVEDEVIDWDTQWSNKGDASNNGRYRLQTRYTPLVKKDGNAVFASAPTDVEVKIDGVVVPVHAVFARTGEIDLITTPTFDPTTEKNVQPIIPTASSVVTVTYHRKGNYVRTGLDHKAKVFYRLTTVALDPTGTSPSGYVETPLGHSPAATVMDTEQMDYIWREAVKRNRWILEQGGERVKLFIKRETGVPCFSCRWDDRLIDVSKQPDSHCEECFGTGFTGGYEGPIDLIVAPDDAPRTVAQTPNGRRLDHSYDVWTGPRPMLSQRDFIVKQNGERYSIGPVTRTAARGTVLQQSFSIRYIDECDIKYKVPVTGPLPWPETRLTRPEDGCADADPYPVGFDYQATPMGTEAAKIPDGREQRGRTPVWQNLTYGGKGGR